MSRAIIGLCPIMALDDVYHTNFKMTATDEKAVLLISFSSSWEFVT